MSSLSRFNPKAGAADFWSEFRKPNPLRWPILVASTAPLALILYWASSETAYKTPERPRITYITTLDSARSDAEIAASNRANQEVKDLRAEAEAELAARKRKIYKALGKGLGMDVEEIAAEADARQAAEAAERAKRLAERRAELGAERQAAGEAAGEATGEAGASTPDPAAGAPGESSAP